MIKNLFNKYFARSLLIAIAYYILVFLGLLLILLWVYMRFLRIKLPKVIPFLLTEFTFCSLLIICGIYLYVIIRILYPKEPNSLVINVLSIVVMPFKYVDIFIKFNKYIYPYYGNIFDNVCNQLDFMSAQDRLKKVYIFQLIPRTLLLLIFMVDIFYFKYLEIFYYFILLGVMPLVYDYIMYSISVAFELKIKALESFYREITLLEKSNQSLTEATTDDTYQTHNPKAIYHDTEVTIKRYIEVQFETIDNHDPKDESTQIEYEGIPYPKKEVTEIYRKKNNITVGDTHADRVKYYATMDYRKENEVLEEPFNKLMPQLLILNTFINYNKKTLQLPRIKRIKLGIIIMYFICWTYILIVSISTLKDISITLKILEILTEYAKITNPFI